jgi:hypothetical protein
MNLNSKYFDSIRATKRTETVVKAEVKCDWPACDDKAGYPAPASPGEQGKRTFCYTHIREYNKSYDFFEGMSDDDIENYRRGASTGHRPTWSMGARRAKGIKEGDWQFDDPLEIMSHAGPVKGESKRAPRVSTGQKRALEIMDLEANATPQDVRKRFKLLVKKYHPDANGGERMYETQLQKTIQAHDYLKASGFC